MIPVRLILAALFTVFTDIREIRKRLDCGSCPNTPRCLAREGCLRAAGVIEKG